MQIIIIPHWTVYKCPSRPYICAFWQNRYGFDNVIGFRALFCVFRQHVITSYKHVDPRADSSFAPSQWETALLTGDPLHSRALAHSRAPLFTQPCTHCSHSRAPREQWARLCVFTLQGCVQAARLCRGSPVLLCNDVSHWLDASLQSAVTVEKQSNVGLVVSMRCYHPEKKNPAITKKPTIADPWSLSNIDCLNTETRYSCYDYTQ